MSICKFGTLSLIGLKYWVKGELIRSDVREGQAGVEIVLDGQFVDVDVRLTGRRLLAASVSP